MAQGNILNPHTRIDPYEGKGRVWSGNPNQALVAEIEDLAPGTAVDIGAGEGADSVWLASQGWKVTAVEPSETASRHAYGAANAAGVTWVRSPLAEADLPADSFDLVSVFYPALLRTEDNESESILTRLVAPGGTLLVVSHADVDRERALAHGFNPDDYLDHDTFVAALCNDNRWDIMVNERRQRHIEGGQGAHHHEDWVLRARRIA